MRVYSGIDQSGCSIGVTCNTTVTQWSHNKEKESGSHKKDRQEVQFHFNVYFSRENHPELQLGRVLKPCVVSAL